MPTHSDELPDVLQRLRSEYQPPRPPAGYLDTLETKVAARTRRPARVRSLWPRLLAVAASVLLLVIGVWYATDAPSEQVATTETLPPAAEPYAPAIDEDFLLSVVLLEAEDLVLPEEYLLEEELYLLDLEF